MLPRSGSGTTTKWAGVGSGVLMLDAGLLGGAEKPPKCKREVQGPREGFMIENVQAQTVTAIPYDIVKEGLQT